MNPDDTLELASEFPPASYESWRAAVDQVLARGRSDLTREELDERFELELTTTTYDGIAIQPLYTAANFRIPNDSVGYPGFAPFVRGGTPYREIPGAWDVRQPVGVFATEVSTRVSDLLAGGASSILLRRQIERGDINVDVLDETLDGVDLELVTIALDSRIGRKGAEALLHLWERRNVGDDSARGSLGLDPIGEFGSTRDRRELTHGIGEVVELALSCSSRYPHVRSLGVDVSRYHEAGASDVEELGCAIATGVEYLRLLCDAGLEVSRALAQLEFCFVASADQFLTVAKLRAARRLWAKVAESVSVGQEGAQCQNVTTSRAMLTAYDPWVNLLRNTVACFAAAVAGADSVTVEPHDLLVGPSDANNLGERMARNTQVILAEESEIGRVLDPVGGSWYVESLTDALATRAWDWFQQIERADGMTSALELGLIGDRLEKTWAKRRANIARTTDAITGISEFPNIDDRAPLWRTSPPTPRVGLPRHRYAEDFEELRSRTDEYERRHLERPVILLAQLGSPNDYEPRSTFARNLFESAGLRTFAYEIANRAGDLRDDVARVGARLACLCSSDANYADQGVVALHRLRRAELEHLYVAARPDTSSDALRSAGVEEFIYEGCDVVDILQRTLATLGVD